MPEYLLELYVPAGAASAAGMSAGRIREVVDTVASSGKALHYLRSIYAAADETCFVLLEAETIEIAQEVARLADIPSNRVSEVITDVAVPMNEVWRPDLIGRHDNEGVGPR